MADHDRPGPPCNFPLYVSGIQSHRIAIYIGKNSDSPHSWHSRRCSKKCERRHNNLIARSYPHREQSRLKRRRTTGKRQPVFTADVFGELALELGD